MILGPQLRVAEFTSETIRFSGKIDSKGRVTIPSRIRDKLEIEKGDRISFQLESVRVLKKQFSSEKKALEFLKGLNGIKSFSFDGNELEVVLK